MANVDGTVVNYSRPRPSLGSNGNGNGPRPSTGRNARTDDEARVKKDNQFRIRARSVPRARVASPSPSVSVSISSLTATMSPSTVEMQNRWKQRESVQSQQSSLYPPSTVTSASAFSGPETPPEPEPGPDTLPIPDLPLLNVDDVDYRLKLLVKNSYYLPPVHQKPTALQLSASNSNTTITPIQTSKQPTIKSFFRGNKSPKTPPSPHSHSHPHAHINPPSSTIPRNPRPQNRVVVIREKLPSLILEPSSLSIPAEEPVIIPHQIDVLVDPTTAVDGVAALIQSSPVQPSPEQHQPAHDDWRRDLLQQAVGLSFVTPPVRQHSLPTQDSTPVPLPYGQPISAGVNNIGSREGSGTALVPVSREFRPPIVDSHLQIAALRSPKIDNGAQNTALKPPPRPPRERSRATEESPSASFSPQSPHGEYDPVFHQDPSFRDHTSFRENAFPMGQRAERDMDLMSPEPMLIRPSFSQSPRPSFASPTPQSPPTHPGSLPYSSSPFGQPISRPPPRHSSTTDRTSGFHYSEPGDVYAASRPSMTASSVQSAPRPSISESQVSHYSTTFGERNRDSRGHSSNSRRSSLAYLRGSRSRSLSPSGSRLASTYSASDAPPVPPLPVRSGSDVEARSTRTVVYVHPTGALSNTAVGTTTPASVHRTGGSSNGHGSEGSAYLDPKRGITNCPIPASPTPSSRFFGFVPPTFMSPRSKALALPATVDVDILMGETRVDVNGPGGAEERAKSDDGHGEKQEAVENWRDALVYNEEVRRFDGMVIQHIESEKDRFKRIASRGREE